MCTPLSETDLYLALLSIRLKFRFMVVSKVGELDETNIFCWKLKEPLAPKRNAVRKGMAREGRPFIF